MKIREDILGNIPDIGDTIAYNPPRYKGLVHGICVRFTSSGLAEEAVKEVETEMNDVMKEEGIWTKKQVEELLQKQRELSLEKARVTYDNYEDFINGKASYIVEESSILNNKLEIQ